MFTTAPHLGPAEDIYGMPVERVWQDPHGNTVVNHEMLYGPVRLGCPASSPPKQEETVAEALASFDAMAEFHRAAAKQRAERKEPKGPQCAATVGAGASARQCSLPARPGSAFCGRHPARPSSSDDFEAEPQLADRPDNFAF